MKVFIRILLLFLIPFGLLILLYAWVDPFKVIWEYDEILSEEIMIDRSLYGVKYYERNAAEYQYDSFIFGSSKANAFSTREWKKYLPDSSSVFLFNSWNESIKGILLKLQFLDQQGAQINHVLFILDPDRTFQKNADQFIEHVHYKLNGKSPLLYHYEQFRQFLDPKVFFASIDYHFFGKRRDYMSAFVGMKPGDTDPLHNDWFPGTDLRLKNDEKAYYDKQAKLLYKRCDRSVTLHDKISEAEVEVLKKIKYYLDKHNTKTKVIISPVFNYVTFNQKDKMILNEYFGEENIFDFSGKNLITEDRFNYQGDLVHFRKKLGTLLIDSIYKGSEPNTDY